MSWTQLCARYKPKTNKTKNTTQYVLDTTMHKTQDADKQAKNTKLYVLDTTIHKTQDADKQSKNHNTICVGHHYTLTNKHMISVYCKSFPLFCRYFKSTK